MRPSDERGIARAASQLRRAARILHAQGRARGLLAFRIADTHVHVLLAATRVEAGLFARHAESALRQALRLPVPFERARIRPIANDRHLQNALRYVFKQEEHHGTAFDPAHDGSSFADMLGMRVGGEPSLRGLQRALPRLNIATVSEWVGGPSLAEVTPELDLLPDAAAAALALPDLDGRTRLHQLARRAAAHAVDLRTSQLATLLGVTPRAVHRFRRARVDAALVRAVQLQLRWRTALRQRANTAWSAGSLPSDRVDE